MRKTGWITLLVVSTCAAFALGVIVGGARKPEVRYRPVPREDEREKPEPPRGRLLARIRRLGKTVSELGRKSSPLPNSDEEQRYTEYEQWKKERERGERSRALFESARGLRRKIVQRKDKALREEGLAELATLVRSDDPDELLLGFTALLHLDGMEVGSESFKPQILDALHHGSSEVRQAALNCIGMVCEEEEALEVALDMVNDPSPEVRRSAAFHLGSVSGKERAEDVEGILTSLLWDEEETVRKRALMALSETYQSFEEGERARKIENLVTDVSSDPERASEILGWWEARTKFSAEDVGRFAQMLAEGEIELFGQEGYTERALKLQFDPYLLDGGVEAIVPEVCLRAVRDSLDDGLRGRALKILGEQQDKSFLPRLEEIASSGRAAGIEEELARTVEYIRGRPPLPSLSVRARREQEREDKEEAAE